MLSCQAIREFTRLRDVYYWKTAVLIAKNQLSKQYRNSFLGMLWTLIQPGTLVLVYSVIMPMIMKFASDGYVLFIVASLTLWTFISSALISASNSIVTQGETLKRCIISSTVFPVADVMKSFYNYFVSFTVMYLVVATFFEGFHPYVLLVPLYLIPVLIILIAGGIAVAFIAPYVRDIAELIQMTMMVMIWLTPIFYPITVLPAKWQAVMEWNPFYIMVHPVQMLVYEKQIPTLFQDIKLLGLTVICIGIGYVLYRLCRRNYVYYI